MTRLRKVVLRSHLNGISVAVKVLHHCALAATRRWLEFVFCRGEGWTGQLLWNCWLGGSLESSEAHMPRAEAPLSLSKNRLPVLWFSFSPAWCAPSLHSVFRKLLFRAGAAHESRPPGSSAASRSCGRAASELRINDSELRFSTRKLLSADKYWISDWSSCYIIMWKINK